MKWKRNVASCIQRKYCARPTVPDYGEPRCPYCDTRFRTAELRKPTPDAASAVACLAVRDRNPHGGIVAFALFALVRRVLLFFAKAIYHAAQRLRLDALLAPLKATLFVF